MKDTREAICERIRHMWERAGKPPVRQVEHRLWDEKRVRVSNTAIGYYLHCRPQCPEPEKMDVELVKGLTELFGNGRTLAQISPTLDRRAQEEADRLDERSRFLRAGYAARDSNPEPTESRLLPGDLMVA